MMEPTFDQMREIIDSLDLSSFDKDRIKARMVNKPAFIPGYIALLLAICEVQNGISRKRF